jgi:integrase
MARIGSTKTEYESIWRNHIEPKLGAIALRDLSAEAIRGWYAGLGSDKPGRRKNAYSLLHGILKTAVNDQLIERNPCMISGAMTISRASEPDYLSPKELATVVDAMPERLQALVLLCAWCGLRWSEVTELRRGDFNADYTGFAITRHATHKGGCSIGRTKSGKVRTALIPEAIRTAIKAHLDEYVDADRDALVFAPMRGGCHVNDQVFNDHFKPALAKIGRETAHIHDLRHSGATTFTHIGASATELQKFLGHSTPLMAMRYAAATDERREILTDRLSKLAESPNGVSDSSS